MTINHAILGLLSWKPATGYELKKIFEESSFLYWSGNNNQIYRSLLQLLEEGLVTGELQYQEASPSKKVYTITDEGKEELKKWMLSAPEAPEFKKPFLIQLAWADLLSEEELKTLFLKYENEIRLCLLMEQEKKRRGLNALDITGRERVLWEKIADNLISSLKGELDWIQDTKDALFENKGEEQPSGIESQVIEKEGQRYLEIVRVKEPVSEEDSALELIALCGEYDTNRLLLHKEVLADGFFRQKSGIAGRILQKFSNYSVKTAILLSDETAFGRTENFIKGRNITACLFESREDAEKWLLE
ncbi:MAG TPA: DUF4180 domain-containing protein [Lachnospiraceae bacterium]|nr:DUF4180 domain-containing protein [Lachnospiraceae bacterium]